MKLNRVAIIYKVFTHTKRPRAKIHNACVAAIAKALSKRKIPYRLIPRKRTTKHLPKIDLLISIGGDGTFLAATHVAGSVPILGVNSLPEYSVGFFCRANAKNFGHVIDEIRRSKFKPIKLPLIEIHVGKKKLPVLALNDILFSSPTPAETVRYKISAKGTTESQQSSGVWISAGPGSTAGIYSAGGKKLPLNSKRLQFIVREPCTFNTARPHLVRGILGEGKKITITPITENSFIYVDGERFIYRLKAGAQLKISVSRKYALAFL